MGFQNLILEVQENIATVTVNREKAMNALNADVLKEIRLCFSELSDRADVRGVVITGAGDKAFVAGADIAAMGKMTPAEAGEFGALGHAAMNAVDHCKKPVIAAVNGFCLGGGLELALACDFIYASEKAKLGLPEVGLGLFPGWGGTQRLPRRIGLGRAKELIFSGRVISAEEASAWGIVNKICKPEELMAQVTTTVKEIAKKGPLAVQFAKKVIREGVDRPLEHGLETERGNFSRCFETEDLKEGLAAFLEKRPPQFKGK